MTTTLPSAPEPGLAPDEVAPARRVPALEGWLAGVLGAGAALSVGELAARFSDSIISLVLAVGGVIVRATPGDLIAESINNLGGNQKPLLLGGIVVASLLIGGWLGASGRSKRSTVLFGFALFGVVGGLASASDATTSAVESWFVSLLAAAIGAIVTLVLLAFAATNRPQQVIVPGDPLANATDRRRFIAYGSAAVGTTALYAASRVGGTSAAERAREDALAETVPSGSIAPDVIDLPVGEFDSIDGISKRIIPISPEDEFYRIDTRFSPLEVDPEGWSLTIDGMVERELTFTYDDLRNRDLIEREATISCVSNPVGGPYVGNAIWGGILLSDLLDEAGTDPDDPSTQVFSRSVDGWTCGFPTRLAYDGRTSMLAIEMNGEPLPIKHGFPARLIVAGIYGYVSATKWIERISITDWESVNGFWIGKGWSKEGPIKTQSRIDVPRNNATVAAGVTPIAGIAWSPTIGIEQVEVRLSPDGSWQQAEIAAPDTDEAWVQWKYDWNATPGDHIVSVRATDKTGFTQSPIPVRSDPNGAEGHHTIRISVA